MPYCPTCGSDVAHEQLSLDSDDENATGSHAHIHGDADPVPGGVQQPISLPKSADVGLAEARANRPTSIDTSSPPSPKSSDSSGEPKPRQPRILPSALRRKEQRLIVRRAMICQVPGINRVRAEAIVDKYQSLRALMNAPEHELAALTIKKSPLGIELAVAIKRVFG